MTTLKVFLVSGVIGVMRILFSAAIYIVASLLPASAADPFGIWLARNGKANVKVAKCGSGICANIISLKKPNDKNGKPLHDGNNPNPRLKSRPILGLPLFVSMRKTGNGTWQGKVYDPEKGGTFKGYVTQISGNILKVQGCLSMGFPCETYMWKRIK